MLLDGLELNTGDYQLELWQVPPAKKKPQWVSGGDSDGAILAEEAHYENRVVQARVRVTQQATMDLALAAVAALTDKLQEAERGGINAVWTPAGSTKSASLRVLMGEVDELPVVVTGDDAGWFVRSPVAAFTLTCRPGLYGSEVTGSSTSSSLPLMTVELTGVAGDLPAEARLIVTDNASQSRRHVEWGLESRYYPTSSPPGLILDSDSLVTSGFAGTGGTRTGAYDPNASGSNVITTSILRPQPQAICGTGNQSHVGTFRVKARCWVSATTAAARLTWREGDGPYRAGAYAVPQTTGWVELDLGLITVPEKVLGTQRWDGRVEAYSTSTGGETFEVDFLTLVPAGEGYGKIRAAYAYRPGVVVAHDEFTGITAATVLNARVAPAGGTWATSGATTDFAAYDFSVSSTGAQVETEVRSTSSDSGAGRLAILGSTNYVAVEAGVDVLWGAAIAPLELGVIARYVDANNHLKALISVDPDRGVGVYVYKVVAGTATPLVYRYTGGSWSTWFGLRLIVYATGIGFAQMAYAGQVRGTFAFSDAVLATGGTLQTGKVGFYDRNSSAVGGIGRHYKDFYVATPTPEPIALYSGQSLEVRSDTALREDSTGTYWGPPPEYIGARFTVPPAGGEGRKARVAVKARRNDVETGNDDAIADSLTVSVAHTPVFLTVPR